MVPFLSTMEEMMALSQNRLPSLRRLCISPRHSRPALMAAQRSAYSSGGCTPDLSMRGFWPSTSDLS